MTEYTELYHFGIPGMKWGVRKVKAVYNKAMPVMRTISAASKFLRPLGVAKQKSLKYKHMTELDRISTIQYSEFNRYMENRPNLKTTTDFLLRKYGMLKYK